MAAKLSDLATGFRPEISCPAFKTVPLGSHTAMEALFPSFVAVLEGFCWNSFQLIGYAVLDIIQVPKWRLSSGF
jgi:hypothetical protein